MLVSKYKNKAGQECVSLVVGEKELITTKNSKVYRITLTPKLINKVKMMSVALLVAIGALIIKSGNPAVPVKASPNKTLTIKTNTVPEMIWGRNKSTLNSPANKRCL